MADERFTPESPDLPTHVRRWIFLIACAASWLLYVHRYSWGVIKPTFRQEHPGLDDTDIGWLDAAFMAAYALGQVPGGLAGDVFGPRVILSGVALVWSLAVAGVAWTAGFWRLFGMRAAFGLSQAAAYPVISQMTRNWFPLASRATVQGIVTALGRVGAACSPVLVATLLMGELGLSWQNALLVLALPGVVLAGGCWLVVRTNPREHPWSNAAEQKLLDSGSRSSLASARTALRLDAASLFSLAMLLLYSFASSFQDQLYVNWISSFLVDGRGLSLRQMGLFTTLPLLGGAVGGILGGLLNDGLLRRTGNRRWTRSGVAFTGKSVAAGLIVLSVQMQDGRLAMLVLLTARVFGDWSLTTMWAALTEMGGRATATVFGLVNMLGAAGGFVAGPVLGSLKQHHGWEGLFLGAAAMCLVSALCWLFIDCTRQLVSD